MSTTTLSRFGTPNGVVCDVVQCLDKGFVFSSISLSLSLLTLGQAIVEAPEVFENLGFTGGSSLADPCLTVDFIIDDQADIMGTQVCYFDVKNSVNLARKITI